MYLLKRYDKLNKNRYLETEVYNMYHIKTITVPLLLGGHDTIRMGCHKLVDKIPRESCLREIRKNVMTSTTQILIKSLFV